MRVMCIFNLGYIRINFSNFKYQYSLTVGNSEMFLLTYGI